MEIRCLDISRQYIVSGQEGSRQSKEKESVVIQWSISQLKEVKRYNGLYQECN